MDNITPKSDVFNANSDRAASLLAKLKADGIGHMIDGKTVPSISGATFETKSPVDGAILASVARRRGGYRPRSDGGRIGVQGLARHARDHAQEAAASRCRCHRGSR